MESQIEINNLIAACKEKRNVNESIQHIIFNSIFTYLEALRLIRD